MYYYYYYHYDDDDGGGDDEYTNLYNLCLLLFLFIYSSLSTSFCFLHYLTIHYHHHILGLYKEAIEDYSRISSALSNLRAAGIENGGNGMFTTESIKMEVNKLQLLLQTDIIKKNADKEFSQGNIQSALSSYTTALDMLPMHVGCLSNRSACKISIGDVSCFLLCSITVWVYCIYDDDDDDADDDICL